MWRLCLAAVIVAPIARMVLCGITRCQFTIHSRTEVAVGETRADAGRSRASSVDSQHASRIFSATFFAASVSVFASAASIVSPDHPQTFAYGEMICDQLYLERAGDQ